MAATVPGGARADADAAGRCGRTGAVSDVLGQQPGEVLVVLGNEHEEVGRIRTTRAEICNFADVPDEFALAEAEGDLSGDDFRASHRDYWSRQGIEIKDDTKVVLMYFEVVESRFQQS